MSDCKKHQWRLNGYSPCPFCEIEKLRQRLASKDKQLFEENLQVKRLESQLAEARAEVERLQHQLKSERAAFHAGMMSYLHQDDLIAEQARQEAARTVLQIISMETIDRPFEQSQAADIIRQRFGLEG